MLREFAALFPATIELALCAIVFALALGIPAGMIAAVRRNSIFDHGVMGVSLTGYSMPIFWWGLLLILLFSVQFGWTPVSGRISVKYFIEPVTGFLTVDALLSGQKGAFRSAVSHLILPTIVLGTQPLAMIARMTRSAMLEVLGEDYIRTARAKGLSNFRVVALHALLGNALIPVITVIGLQVGGLFTRRNPDPRHLSVARRRQVADRGDQPPRLPGAAGRRAAPRAGGDGGQPARRPHRRHHQPPHPARVMTTEAATRSAPSKPAPAPRGPLREFWEDSSANRGAVAGLIFVVGILLVAAFANVLAPYPPDLTNSAVFLKPPAWQAGGRWAYPLGTDAIGRDILSRLIHGARLSLLIGIAVVALAIVVGIALGLLAGFRRGVVEIAIMRLMDIILTLPSLLLAIVIVAILGPGLMNAMLAVVVVVLPHYVRITRAAVITETSKDYVTAARASGATSSCGSCSARCCRTASRR